MMVYKLLISGLALVLAACATGPRLAGECQRLEVPGRLQSTLMDACQGNQQASYAIGQYFESAGEEEADQNSYATAAYFYTIASTASSGQTFIYVPGAGKVAGYTMPVTTGPRTEGLREARTRLAKLYYEGRGVKQDKKKACRLLQAGSQSTNSQDKFSCGE